jgi:hypothetical protein
MAKQKRIQYLAVNGERWQAELEDAKKNAIGQWADPDFRHYREDGGYSHKDDKIGYTTGDGTKWYSKCHSHEQVDGGVNFTFEHFNWGNSSPDHEDRTIVFRGWDGQTYKCWMDDYRGDIPRPIELLFNVTAE